MASLSYSPKVEELLSMMKSPTYKDERWIRQAVSRANDSKKPKKAMRELREKVKEGRVWTLALPNFSD